MPRYNPNDSRQLNRLRDAMKWSRTQVNYFVKDNVAKLRAYVGRMYGENGAREPRPVNTIRAAVDIWQRKIVTRSPSVLVTTREGQLRARAYEFQLALNHLLKEIGFGGTLEEATKMALMGFSVVKVGICPTTDVQNPNWRYDNGQPYASAVLWEDWVHDMNARRFDEIDFAANRFRVDLEDLQSNPMYDPSVVGSLQADADSSELDQFGEGEDDRSTLSIQEGQLNRQEYREYVEIWEIWLPRDRLIVTLPAQEMSKPILVREWEGPERGPFHYLTYGKVPGNVMGADPTANLFDLDDLYNKMFSKVGRQGLRQKTLTFFNPSGASEGTAQTILDAEDGQGIPVNDPQGIREVAMGGVNANSLAFTTQLRQLVSMAGGNLDLLGGLAPQSSTAKQDAILSESSNELVRDLQDATATFVSGIVTDLGYYLWHDPLIQLPLVKRIPGTDVNIPFVFSPDTREGDFYEYAIAVDPHTMRIKSPEERLSQILQLTEGAILKLLPLLQQQGWQFNAGELLRLISQYANLPELESLLVQAPPMAGQGGGAPNGPPQQQPGAPKMPTERRYVRESRSTGGTQGARDQVLMNALLSGSSQLSPQQIAAGGQ